MSWLNLALTFGFCGCFVRFRFSCSLSLFLLWLKTFFFLLTFFQLCFPFLFFFSFGCFFFCSFGLFFSHLKSLLFILLFLFFLFLLKKFSDHFIPAFCVATRPLSSLPFSCLLLLWVSFPRFLFLQFLVSWWRSEFSFAIRSNFFQTHSLPKNFLR